MHYKQLADVTRYLKKDEGGVRSMCKIMEEVREEGRLEAKIQTKYEVAAIMLSKGTYSLDEIAEISQLPLDEIIILSQQQDA